MQNNKNKGSYFNPAIPEPQLKQLSLYEQKRKAQKKELIKTGIIIGAAIMGYLIMQTVAAAAFLKGEIRELYDSSPVFNNTFNMIAVHFASVFLPFGIMALILRKQFISPVIPSKKVKKGVLFSWIAVGMAFCVLSNYFVSVIMALCESLGYKLTQGETLEPNSVLACVTCVFSVAIVPPLVEEFAMRCCTLGVLRKYGMGFAVLTVSIVFGLLHGNVIQFIFAFLIGLILAVVTVRTENILPAILIHAFNNGISALNDVLKYALQKDISTTFIACVYVLWLALGIVGLAYLLLKKELLPQKKEKAPKEPYELSFGSKLACLLPGFALPILMLVVITISTIEKI